MSYTGLHLPSIFMISAVATSLPLRGAQAWICKIFLIIHIHNVIITQYIMSGTFTFTLWPPCPSTQVLTDLCKYVCKLQDLDFIQPTFGRVELNINHHSYGLRRRELICNLFLLLLILFGEDTVGISPSDFLFLSPSFLCYLAFRPVVSRFLQPLLAAGKKNPISTWQCNQLFEKIAFIFNGLDNRLRKKWFSEDLKRLSLLLKCH